MRDGAWQREEVASVVKWAVEENILVEIRVGLKRIRLHKFQNNFYGLSPHGQCYFYLNVFRDISQDDRLYLLGRGKILSAHFRYLFLAIKWKLRLLHYMFKGNFIKITYNNAYRN